MTLEIQVIAWDRHKNVTGLNRLMRLDDRYVTPGNMCSGRWICQPRQYVQWTMDMSPQAICAVDDGYVTPGNMCRRYVYKSRYDTFFVKWIVIFNV